MSGAADDELLPAMTPVDGVRTAEAADGVDDAESSDGAELEGPLEGLGVLVAKIPSRAGYHLISKPFNRTLYTKPQEIDLHYDNPTNLYVPGSAR